MIHSDKGKNSPKCLKPAEASYFRGELYCGTPAMKVEAVGPESMQTDMV